LFKNKIILITGGTGSFGNALVSKLINTNLLEIRIFSRDEKKQEEMRRFYNSSKLKFYLGDVRDPSSLDYPLSNVDFIFHAAALKQVPSCEFYPLEAIKTNSIGTSNVIDKAINCNVKKIVCLSTDKAVSPINAMGMTKALMEKIAISKSRIKSNTEIVVTRYGNVIGSRGSVIPLFYEYLKQNKKLPITDSNMTRFMMSMDDAIDLVLYAFKNGQTGDILVKKSPSATLELIAQAMINLYGNKKLDLNIIGHRHGEKMHETLISENEMINSIEKKEYFVIKPDKRDLNYSLYFDKGQSKLSKSISYRSDNTHLLTINELEILLKKSFKIK